ncbi:Ig-like domain-containing protein [Paenibacillus pabuli]|uniref:Ig-like domain-containing protein n=1 Tax=Paenibacillus pabuli TaxID=1472 RepID=UPI003242A0C9
MNRIKLTLRGMLALILICTIMAPSHILAATGDVTSIEITNSSPQKLSVSQTVALKVMAVVEGFDNKQDVTAGVTWSTSNAAVATIVKGKVKAVSAGEATIHAEVDGAKAQLVVQVSEKIKSIKASPKSYSFVKGSESALPKVSIVRASGKEEDVTSEIVWTVSNAAAVVENGKIKGNTPGRVLLQGKYGSETVKVPVAITDIITKVEVTPTAMQLNIKKSKALKVIGTYANGKTINLSKQVTWTSSDNAVATVKNGTVKTLTEGKATLTGTYQDQTIKTEVTVVPLLKKLITGQKKLVLSPQGSAMLTIMAQYDTGKTTVVTNNAAWSSTKPSVATVTNGKVVAVGKGKTSIIAKWNNKKVTIPVTVK